VVEEDFWAIFGRLGSYAIVDHIPLCWSLDLNWTLEPYGKSVSVCTAEDWTV